MPQKRFNLLSKWAATYPEHLRASTPAWTRRGGVLSVAPIRRALNGVSVSSDRNSQPRLELPGTRDVAGGIAPGEALSTVRAEFPALTRRHAGQTASTPAWTRRGGVLSVAPIRRALNGVSVSSDRNSQPRLELH